GAASGVGAAQRCHIAVVAALTNPDIAVGESATLRWVVRHPAAAPPLDPGMAFTFHGFVGFAATGMQVARHISSRQTDGAQGTQRDVAVVLADAATQLPGLAGGAGDLGGATLVAQMIMNQSTNVERRQSRWLLS